MLPHDRLVFYRAQAEEALHQASSAHDAAIRTGLLNIAAAWNRLIRECETLMEDGPRAAAPAPRHPH